MIHGIDHLAIAVPDPDAAATELERVLGVAATGGGRHEGFGTVNRLAWLADGSYLELIGVEDDAAAGRWPMGEAAVAALARGGGLAAYALDARPLEPDVRTLQGYGSDIGDPVAGSRRRPDGDVVRWWTALPPRIGPNGVPFLIEHVRAGAEWGAEALSERAGYRHPIGSPARLVRLDLAVADPAASAAEHAKQLGMSFQKVGDAYSWSSGGHVVRLLPEMGAEAPVVVSLAADAAARSAELFGVRFAIDQAVPSPP